MSRDTSFYYSFLVLPPSKRKAIIAVWDFCRAVDDAVDEAAHRVRRTAAIVEQVEPRGVASRRDILAKRADEILEQRHRQPDRANARAECEKDLDGVRRLSRTRWRTGVSGHCIGGHSGAVEAAQPAVEQRMPLGRRPPAFVRDVIRSTGERVHRGDVRPHAAGQEQRRDRKVLVMDPRVALACRIRRGENSGRGAGRHSNLVFYWTWISTKRSTH